MSSFLFSIADRSISTVLLNYVSAVQGVDEELAKYYKNNLTMLAAAKTATITNRLIAARKQSKDRDEYNKLSKQITNTYNRYTAAEYNTMVHRVRVAKQFEQFQHEKQLYPNIEWLPSRAANPDIVHRGYWYHVWAADDPFWKNNFPGCRWGCKCSWRTTDAPLTDKSNVELIPPSPGLDGNPYFTKEIISKSHPYYRGVEKHIPKLGVLHNPDDVVFINYDLGNGKKVEVHYLVLQEDEFSDNIKIAEALLQHGHDRIRLLPRIHSSEISLRNRYFGKEYVRKYPDKNPDAVIQNRIVEFKTAKIETLVKQLNKASQQSNVAVVKLKDKVSKDLIENKIKAHEFNLKTIIILMTDELLVFKI